MSKKVNGFSSLDERIEGIRMRESDRRIAKAHMRDADVVADLILRAAEKLRPGKDVLASLFAKRPS